MIGPNQPPSKWQTSEWHFLAAKPAHSGLITAKLSPTSGVAANSGDAVEIDNNRRTRKVPDGTSGYNSPPQ